MTLDPAKLAAHRVTAAQLTAALQQAAVVQSIGSLKQGSATIPLQVSGSLTSLDRISALTVPATAAATGGGASRSAPTSASTASPSAGVSGSRSPSPAGTAAAGGSVSVGTTDRPRSSSCRPT